MLHHTTTIAPPLLHYLSHQPHHYCASKVIVIALGDEHFDDINDVEDIDKCYPGMAV